MKPFAWTARTARALLGATLVSLALATTAVATPAPPYTQCPPIGPDVGCGTLIDVGEGGRLEAFNDPREPPVGTEDALIGVQNDSGAPLQRIPITGTPQIFRFDGNGICSGLYPDQPQGCPFGPTRYEGPGTAFDPDPEDPRVGAIEFTGGGLAPGASTYFDLEGVSLGGLTELGCGPEGETQGCHTLEPILMTQTLSSEGRSGVRVVVPEAGSATEQATLSGLKASQAGGTVEYDVYSDERCTHLVTDAGTVAVSAGTVPESSAVTLPPGTYYWRATYSGDVENAGVQGVCGSIAEFVQRECVAAAGVGHLGPRGPEGLTEANSLDVLGAHHRLSIARPGLRVHLRALTSASCIGWHEFVGAGPARVNGAPGYFVSFTIASGEEGVFLTVLVEKEGTVVLSLDHERLGKHARERFS